MRFRMCAMRLSYWTRLPGASGVLCFSVLGACSADALCGGPSGLCVDVASSAGSAGKGTVVPATGGTGGKPGGSSSTAGSSSNDLAGAPLDDSDGWTGGFEAPDEGNAGEGGAPSGEASSCDAETFEATL